MSNYQSIFEADYFSKGFAVCEPRILTDTIYCRFRDEHFEFPSKEIYPIIRSLSGGFHHCEVERLRKFKTNNG